MWGIGDRTTLATQDLCTYFVLCDYSDALTTIILISYGCILIRCLDLASFGIYRTASDEKLGVGLGTRLAWTQCLPEMLSHKVVGASE